MKAWLLIASLTLPSLASAADELAKPATRAFLGVHVVQVPEEVRAQTELAEGEGLMIDFVQADSPAQAVGVQVFDILTQLEDQKLLSCEQFSNLIKSASSHAIVSLTLLRKGKPLNLSVKLGEAPLANSPRATNASADLQKLLPDLLKALDKQPREDKSLAPQSSSMSMSDESGSVEIHRVNDAHHATVKDLKGNVLFSGSIQTETELSAVPGDIRARIRKLEQSAKALTGPR